MVIGDHPHGIQTTESYNGHLILYSMGNFIFDQQSNGEVTRSAALNVQLIDDKDNSDDLDNWLNLGEECVGFKDDCLAIVKSKNLKKLDIEYRLGIVGSNDSGKINKPANDQQQLEILQRLNWQTTINGLQPPYVSL
jgi:poly-gamma-glutamate synthesis protein (capsule biosynthesis protein)